MKKKHNNNMINSLTSSLKDEKKSVASRFDKADSFFNEDSKKDEKKRTVKSKKTTPLKSKSPEIKVEKVVRDAFSMPFSYRGLIDQILTRSMKMGINTNKSEIVRAGIHALLDMSDNKLKEIIKAVPKIKTGRPVK